MAESNPAALGTQKAVEAIGTALQKQYERWQPRARYKQSLDPTIDDIKKLCISLRKSSKDERVLFHYNGHGVPKPTVNGEVWVFNKNYTQYIPLSVYDLQNWMGVPSLYVYDCSNAGIIVESFLQFANSHQEEYEYHRKNFPDDTKEPPQQYGTCIHLAACANGQELPSNPLLPADLFTSCLTTPIKTALRWYTLQNKTRLLPEITLEMIDKIPGQMNDRRTMLGELNWIFTAVTDTIAWNSLPRDLFHRLFRQDLLVASLFRNFLLAERVMRSYKCSPISYPNIPHSTAQHPMWDAWDFTLDACLCQLPAVLEGADYVYSTFFTEQLTAFQVWLTYGSEERMPPEQLPIVLQVLLSQSHRLRALDLLGRFVDLGPWAVNQALSVGIFPYVLKLLQSSARELRPLLVFIWAKILAVDDTCQSEIVREGGHKYFLDILTDSYLPVEHRTMAAFVISKTFAENAAGQEIGLKDNVIAICLEQMAEPRGTLRQWVAITLGVMWTKNAQARWAAVRDSAYEKLFPLLHDPCPEIRAAAVFALGTFVGNDADRSDHANAIDSVIGMQLTNSCCEDASPLVRKELVAALQWLILHFEGQFTSVAYQTEEEERVRDSGITIFSPKDNDGVDKRSPENHMSFNHHKRAPSSTLPGLPQHQSTTTPLRHGTVFQNVWKVLLNCSRDPFPAVAKSATSVTQRIRGKFASLPVSPLINRSDSDTPDRGSPKFGCTVTGLGDSGSPPTKTVPPSKLTNAIPKPADVPAALVNLHRFARTRKLFDAGPNQDDDVDEDMAVKATDAIVTSQFVKWCSKSFTLPMMKLREEQDVSANAHYQREWKFMRNHAVRNSSLVDTENAGPPRYETQIFINRNLEVPSHVLFDPLEPVIYVADRNQISVWNYEKSFRVGSFPNSHPRPYRISDMTLINAHDSPFLLVAADDGSVRAWKNSSSTEKRSEDLVTAWQALPEVLPTTRGSGVVFSWEPPTQHLIAAGDAKIIRVWNMTAEQKVIDIPTRLDCSVTTLSSEPTGSNGVFAAGYQDGSVRLYDRRCSAADAQIMVFDGHASAVVSTKMPDHVLHHKLYSGSVDGDVKLWDLRLPNSVSVIKTVSGMSTMDVHARAEVICCGSVNQTANVYSFLGAQVSSIRHYDGFMGQRIGSVSSVAFHPFKMLLAVACSDTYVSVYTGLTDKKSARQ
ncbi:Regulatory-associated protein of mTOR [Hypsibius exemplaris]|uniref:Regulatory-associated protein of mTOR n=1 Tax=Hypsibius exemplaris TaxID=2072580 RepID=A0A9X6NF08_HYPEX|nr:Regulatory-associated protein of mTOR [Hypsibius exemplaris]